MKPFINFFSGQKNHPGHGQGDRVEGYSPDSLVQSATTLVSNNYSNTLILIGTALTLRGSLHYFVKSSEKNLLLPGLSDLRREDLLD